MSHYILEYLVLSMYMYFFLPCIYCRTRLRPYVFHITFLVLFGVFNIHIQVSRSDCGLEEAITVGNSNLTRTMVVDDTQAAPTPAFVPSSHSII